MAEQKEERAEQAAEETQAEEVSILDQLLAKIDTAAPPEERTEIGNAVGYFLDAVARSAERPERVDGALIDAYIAELDKKMSEQLDEILHHEKFQQLESAWRGLYFLVDRTDFLSNITIEMLDVSKEELAEDFEEVGDPLEGGLFVQTYTQAYDQYGADPVSFMVANYEFGNNPQDIDLLRNIADVAAAVDHVCQVVGDAAHVGLGSDFDGGFGAESTPAEIDTVADLGRVGPALAELGYGEEDIAAVLGGNWLRLLRAALPE